MQYIGYDPIAIEFLIGISNEIFLINLHFIHFLKKKKKKKTVLVVPNSCVISRCVRFSFAQSINALSEHIWFSHFFFCCDIDEHEKPKKKKKSFRKWNTERRNCVIELNPGRSIE